MASRPGFEGGRGWRVTEEEWFATDYVFSLFDSVCRKSSRRKARLFAVACARRVETELPEGRPRVALDLSESYADGLIPYSRLKDLSSHIDDPQTPGEMILDECTRLGKVQAPILIASLACQVAVQNCARDYASEDAAQVLILRDIYGNPFRPVTFDPRWRTTDVVGLAHAIYDDKAFERMPILADALMDAGCEEEQIISHCRSDGPHVRGCWVVDLILEKA